VPTDFQYNEAHTLVSWSVECMTPYDVPWAAGEALQAKVNFGGPHMPNRWSGCDTKPVFLPNTELGLGSQICAVLL
jgi:hypothetical protein